MNINLEPDGIISHVKRHVDAHGGPFTSETDYFEYTKYTYEMAAVFDKFDIDKFKYTESTPDLSIGRIARADDEPDDERISSTQLVLLGEAVGSMPDYESRPGVKKIGSIAIHTKTLHDSHGNMWNTVARTYAGYDADILTNGEVIATCIELEACKNCYGRIDLEQEYWLLMRLGISALDLDYSEASIVGHGWKVFHRPLDTIHVSALKRFLRDTFPAGPLSP